MKKKALAEILGLISVVAVLTMATVDLLRTSRPFVVITAILASIVVGGLAQSLLGRRGSA
jgi:hypothetical protein